MSTIEITSKIEALKELEALIEECVRRPKTTARPLKSDTLTAENRHPFRRSDSWYN